MQHAEAEAPETKLTGVDGWTIGEVEKQPLLQRLFPFLDWMGGVRRNTLRADALAGLTGAAIVLPQGVAFATIAGLPPQYGLFTAMIPPIVAALFGASMAMVSGPTTAISALMFATLSRDYEPGSATYISAALILTFLVGVIQTACGLARLGRFLGLVSHPVIVAFSSGAAILIVLSQLDSVLGVSLGRPEEIGRYLHELVLAIPDANSYTLVIAAGTILTSLVCRRIDPRLPHFMLALLVGGLINWAIGGNAQGVATVGSLPKIVPSFSIPGFDGIQLYTLVQSALAVAMIGLIESISISRTLAYRRDERPDPNREVLGQGLSNLVGGMLSCYVAAGSFTRSALNSDCGARTPMSSIFASVFLLALLAFVAPFFAYLPVPAIGGVILLVGLRLIDVMGFRYIFAKSRNDTVILLTTFSAALFVGLEFSVFIGVLLSLAIFLNDSMQANLELTAPNQNKPNHSFSNVASGVQECPQVAFLRLNGPLYFGAADGIRRGLDWLAQNRPEQKYLVLKLTGVGQVDGTGADVLIQEAQRRNLKGGRLYLTSRFDPLYRRLKGFGVVDAVGDDAIYPHRHDAISDIVPRLDPQICRYCTARIFRECPTKENT